MGVLSVLEKKHKTERSMILLNLVLWIQVLFFPKHHCPRSTRDCHESADMQLPNSLLKMGVGLMWSFAQMDAEVDEPSLPHPAPVQKICCLHQVGSESKAV